MTALAFVDTNVLVYARDRSEADNQRRAAEWMAALWDSRAVRAGARWLATEDLQDGQDLLGVTVVDPFRHAPEEILGA